MRRRYSIIVCCGFLCATATTVAHADPITAVYHISVVQRWNYHTQSIESFHSSFELTLAFDGVSTLFSSPQRTIREYSAPSFSPVSAELVIASRPQGVETFEERRLVDQWFLSDDGYHRQSGATILQTDETFGSRYLSGVHLGRPSISPTSTPPALTTLSMLQALGAGDLYYAFLYTGYATIAPEGGPERFLPNSYQYQGYAFLLRYELSDGEPLPSDPVPEPTTLLLFATGAFGLAARAWKR